MAESYLSRGVSPTKDDVKKAVANQDKGAFPGAFCKLIDDLAGDPDYCTAIHADGAGTKSSVAYIAYRETGDLKWFRGIAQDSLVMNTDDLACVGALEKLSLSNTIGRNAHRVDGKCIAAVIEGYNNIVGKLQDMGFDISMCGGETADVGDLVRTLIVDSTLVTRVAKKNVVNAANIKPGHVIVGIASFGQATYEDSYNSGISSNGLTAARHMLLCKDYLKEYPESVSETIPEDKVYCGKFRLTDKLPNSDQTVAEAILSPTRTFLPVIRDVLDQYRSSISGIIHCTGGGQAKCRDFGKNIRIIKDNLFPFPPIFQAIYESGEIPMKEMYQVFNCGHRIEFYCDESVASGIIDIANKYNIEARIVGRVEALPEGSGNQVVIRSNGEEFIYG
ncbi:MAG TPA: phosphoribosylformylglycinamidine cyclo-ligase [Clostridiales bacterium]|jgi:phosphoribosylformylglycinamidine cyclo-ligase|nr:phosphoribosylformylglycinamidine cyclo-ligase [Clostridiales bacterium]HBZ78214.1 phosphoribosylformylglycinamidine cyclo-ligase [Clostridiales bacterium]